jgi:hypothetical protein
MRTTIASRSLLFLFVLLISCHGAFAQISVGISVSFGPPALPVYEQPICPAEGYLWVPGYWAYDYDDGYYWVPGTWVLAPQVGFLWTPGYWGWGGSAFFFHEGCWGPQVGFYGGVAYGFGYGGVGYEGGRWEGGHFSYNTYVNRVNTTIIHNTYNTTVTNITVNHISYNGGAGGVEARPTPQEESYANERHVGPVAAQIQDVQAARGNPQLRATANHGVPPVAATANPVTSEQALWQLDKQAVNTRLRQPMLHAAMRLVLPPTSTLANYSRTNSPRQTPATPKPPRNISSNRPN